MLEVLIGVLIGFTVLVLLNKYQPQRKQMTKFDDDAGRPSYLDGKTEEAEPVKAQKKKTDTDWLK